MMPVWSILIIIFVAYSVLGWTLFFMQRSFLYRPLRQVLYDPSDINLAFEKVAIETQDGLKIAAWYVPAEKAKYTVLMCHGNGGNIAHRLDTVNLLNEMNLNCMVFDYRGYGTSQGKPTEQGTYIDAQAAWNWLAESKKVPSEKIIIFGRSLGGCVASHLAMNNEPLCLVVESAFTSYVDMGKMFYPYLPVRHFAKYKYPTIEYVRRVGCPTLFIHSRGDEVVPFEFGLKLYDAAREPKEFVEIYGCHNDGFLFSGDTYRQGWKRWLESVEECKAENRQNIRLA